MDRLGYNHVAEGKNMLNWLLLYSLILSFVQRFYYHNKVVVPGNEGGILKGAAMVYVRGVFLSAIFVMGIHSGIFGEGYAEWWATYSAEHSMILWFILVLPVTLGLYCVKEATFAVMKRPGSYGWFDNKNPSLYKLNMRIPLVWNLTFWGWTFCCPWLPFLSCFIRIFLFGAPASVVFPFA